MTHARVATVLFGALAAAGLAAAVAGAYLRRPRVPPLPVLGEVPAFALTERSGRTVTRDDLAGRAWVAGFIFTRCAGICPMMTSRMKELQAEAPEVTLVSLTVDPEHDTPQALRDYAERHGVGGAWHLLTGDQERLHALARDGFRLAAAAVPEAERQPGGDGPFLHSSRLVLVDGRARIRGYYDSAEPAAMAALRRDLASLESGS